MCCGVLRSFLLFLLLICFCLQKEWMFLSVTDLQSKGTSSGTAGPPQRDQHGGFCNGWVQLFVANEIDNEILSRKSHRLIGNLGCGWSRHADGANRQEDPETTEQTQSTRSDRLGRVASPRWYSHSSYYITVWRYVWKHLHLIVNGSSEIHQRWTDALSLPFRETRCKCWNVKRCSHTHFGYFKVGCPFGFYFHENQLPLKASWTVASVSESSNTHTVTSCCKFTVHF